MPSLPSKVALFASLALSSGIVFYVHYKQIDDREKLHLGIERDLERQTMKRAANIHTLLQQEELAVAYRKSESKDQQASKSS